MEMETSQFLQERGERIRLLREKQERELEQFDEESAHFGFRLVTFYSVTIKCLVIFINISIINSSALAISEASTLEQDSLSGSMLSLARSNSTNSFHDGNL